MAGECNSGSRPAKDNYKVTVFKTNGGRGGLREIKLLVEKKGNGSFSLNIAIIRKRKEDHGGAAKHKRRQRLTWDFAEAGGGKRQVTRERKTFGGNAIQSG